MKKKNYIIPKAEIVLPKDRLMLEVTISNHEVNDEAAKKGMFDDDTDWNSQESIWGDKSPSDNENWNVWSNN